MEKEREESLPAAVEKEEDKNMWLVSSAALEEISDDLALHSKTQEIAAYLITFEKHEEWLTTSPKTRMLMATACQYWLSVMQQFRLPVCSEVSAPCRDISAHMSLGSSPYCTSTDALATQQNIPRCRGAIISGHRAPEDPVLHCFHPVNNPDKDSYAHLGLSELGEIKPTGENREDRSEVNPESTS
ncbi:Calmodulin-binding transcription activator 1 [Channa argus]|uniref:Calmodulin-binding transcription activator 1 n=1 Tax=Channa argus TaxID=215402 RepID=A0A6G1Q436_CHAAH|nr:Calmodulin-binding transcription activator 1 [Channa argus]